MTHPSWTSLTVEQRSRALAYSAVTGVWLTAYTWAAAAGQRFSPVLAQSGWQFAPYDLLVSHPISTSWNMTVQPPLWNLVVGTTIRWCPFGDGLALQILIAVIALSIGLLATRLVLVTGLGPTPAGVIGCWAALQPTTWQTVFGVAYELPTALLLLVILNVVATGGGRLSRRQLIGAVTAATALSLVRTVYHPLVLVAALAVFGYLARHTVKRRHIALILGIPLMLIGSLVTKNAAFTGTPSLASWEGMNLLRSVQVAIPIDELRQDAAGGHVSGVALVPAFSPYTEYSEFMPACTVHGEGVREVPIASRAVRSPFSGQMVHPQNFNYSCYQPIFQQARLDAIDLITRHPDHWLAARMVATRAWFSDYPPAWLTGVQSVTHVTLPPPDLAGWNDMYPHFMFDMDVSLVAIASALILMGAALACLIRVARRGSTRIDVVVLASFALYIATFVPSIVFELGEQPRFRSVVDPMVAATVGVVLVKAWRTTRHGLEKRRRSAT